jgi:hypothetical protein
VPHATRPGDVLGGRYRLVDLLTESAGGRFWRAHDPVLERHVAIHVIRGDDDRAPALMDAARRSATVPDQRVLRVLDAECTDDECYVVNEWGWGTSLDIVVAGGATLTPRRASWLVAEVADSVAAAHAVGVAHGRLNPENVLVDRTGNVRIIGLCVDAALHGTDAAASPSADLTDLAGLLYCALTARWAGTSSSIVAAAPRSHGEVLRPRQVRAGVPRPLDLLCDEVLHDHARQREVGEQVATAQGIADYLFEFVGDPTGMTEALLAAVPDVLPEEEQVVLPPVPELPPHSRLRDEPPREPEPQPEPTPDPEPEPAPGDERPTEAGMPIFGDGIDDVSWLERRTTPAPPPPPFEAHPVRPLFAPEPASGTPLRTPRAPARPALGDGEFWPWDTGTGAGDAGDGTAMSPVPDDHVPGRTFLRLGTVLALLVLLGVAVVVAVSLGGGDDADPAPSGGGTSESTGTAPPDERRAATVTALEGVVATAFDPEGDPPTENDEDAPLAVDGDPATSWNTEGYLDQLGPPNGLKSGVGLLLDLGGEREVGQVVLSLVGTPTSVSLYAATEAPSTVEGLEPVARGNADGDRITLDAGGARATHLVVWLTSLPLDDGGRFRGTIAEVVVRREGTDGSDG